MDAKLAILKHHLEKDMLAYRIKMGVEGRNESIEEMAEIIRGIDSMKERRQLVDLAERHRAGEPLTDEDTALIRGLEERYDHSPANAVLAIVDGVFSDIEAGRMSVEDARKHVTGAIGDIAPLLDAITGKSDK